MINEKKGGKAQEIDKVNEAGKAAEAKKKSIISKFKPRGVLGWIVAIALLLVSAAFVVFLGIVNLLPVKYLIPVVVALVAIYLISLFLLAKKKRSTKRILGYIISLITMCVLLVGCSYLYSTYAALDTITKLTTQYDEYDLVVLNEDKYEKVKDIKGKDVYVVKSKADTYSKAQGMLKGKVTVNFQETEDARAAGNKIVEDNGTTHDEVILLSKGNYSMLCDDIDGFKDKTKILKKFKVAQTAGDGSTKDVTEESFNVLVSGIDVWGVASERVSRSDVNMIITVNPKTRQILLTSIPRDAYVKLHSSGQYDKLTHSGIYGIEETRGTIEDWLGIECDFYCRATFSMVVKLVAAVGCIDVYSQYDFKSAISECEYHKGWNHLTGREALYFARERKAFEGMDQARIKNQQKVVKAIMKKMLNSKTLVANYTDILAAISENMQTDMSKSDMSSLAKMQLNDMDKKWTINMNSVKGEMAKKGTYSMGYNRMLDVCIMDEDSVEDAIKKINAVMYPEGNEAVEIKDDKNIEGTLETRVNTKWHPTDSSSSN